MGLVEWSCVAHMNKQALKLKKARQKEKLNSQLLLKDEIVRKLDGYKYNKSQLDRIVREVKTYNKNLTMQSSMLSMMITLYILYKYYQYDGCVLIDYVEYTQRYINSMSNLHPDYLSRCRDEIEETNINVDDELSIISNEIDNIECDVFSLTYKYSYFLCMNCVVWVNYMNYKLKKLDIEPSMIETFMKFGFYLYRCIQLHTLEVSDIVKVLDDNCDIIIDYKNGDISTVR